MFGETHALSKPVTSNSVPTPQEYKFVKNDKVIAPGMFMINHFKTSREEKHVPNTVRASARTKPITVSQPLVFTKKDVNSDSNGLSYIGLDNTKTRRPQPRSNTKNDRVPSTSKSSRSMNKGVEVEEHHRNLLLSKNMKHMSSACNNTKLDSQNLISKVVCAMCKQCLISVNHDVCLRNYVNRKTSHGKKQKESVSIKEKQKKHQSKVIQICLWCVDSGGSKHMTGNLKLLINFVWKLMGTVRFGNDHVAAILGFGDLQWENILITRVYFVEGLSHNLFSVGQFCDSDLEVAFRRNACFVKNLEGVDLLKGDRLTNLYTINLHEMASASPICLMARASSTKSWLWHQCLSHLNFDTINDLARIDLVSGLPKFKYHKEHLCPSCKQGKSKRASHPPKHVPNSRQRLHLLHMDLCGPMRTASINGKKCVLVIVDDYSRYTWVHYLRSKDEAPEVIKTFLKRITVLLQSPVIIIRIDNDTEFKNQTLKEYFDSVGISHQMSSVRTPQQNGVVERRNRTLVEAARTMLIFSRAPLFLWAEAIATAYPKNDREAIGMLGAKGDIGFFIGYSADSCAYKIYNRRTKKIMEIMNVSFDELSTMAFEQCSSKPGLQSMTSGQISSGLDLTYAPSTITTQQPTEGELDLLFEAMYDDFIGGQPSAAQRTVSAAQSQHHAQQQGNQAHLQSKKVAENVLNAMLDGNTFVNHFTNPSTSAAESSSSQNVDPSNMHTFYQPYSHEFQWTKDHPLEQVIGEPSRPVLTRNQLRSDGFIDADHPSHVYKLKKALYGLKQAPRAWYDELSTFLLQNHFFKGTIDPTLFIRHFHDDILVAKPTEKHLKEVKRIFRYLRETVNTGLWYSKDSDFELIGFSDADYAGCKDTFKSTSGEAQFLGEKLVRWSSKKQDCMALSTAEAEYVSLSACCAQVLWMRTQLTDYGFHFNKIPIYCDSKSAIAISCNPVQHSRTKHIVVRCHFIKEHVEKGMIELYFAKTDYQLADLFTKALPADRFNYLVRRLVMNENPSRVNIKQRCGSGWVLGTEMGGLMAFDLDEPMVKEPLQQQNGN
nr:retrovirus-related Pol polyprotein from transposon TNT 1-94 [Tanacetum cinerariifolium]